MGCEGYKVDSNVMRSISNFRLCDDRGSGRLEGGGKRANAVESNDSVRVMSRCRNARVAREYRERREASVESLQGLHLRGTETSSMDASFVIVVVDIENGSWTARGLAHMTI